MKKITICLSCADVYKDGVLIKSEKEVAKLWLLTFNNSKPDIDIIIHICPECSRSVPEEYLGKIRKKYLYLEKTLEQTSS
jgi:hypothetical protein